MGLTLRQLFGINPKEKKKASSLKKEADQLYKDTNEEEKEAIRKDLRLHEEDVQSYKRAGEEQESSYKITKGPMMEALVRRELLKRAQETRGKIQLAGGESLSFLTPSTKKTEEFEEKRNEIADARRVAKELLTRISKQKKQNILYILLSLKQDYNALAEEDVPPQVTSFFINADTRLQQFNKKNKANIPFQTLKKQLFQLLLEEIQPNAGIIKNGRRMERFIKTAKKGPLKKNPLADIDPLTLDPQDILNPKAKEEPINPREASRLLDLEMKAAKRRNAA